MEISKKIREPYGSLCSSTCRSTGAVLFFLNITGETGQLQFQSIPVRDIQGQGPWSTMKWRQAVLEAAKRAQKWGNPMRFIPFDPKKSAGKKHEKPTVNMMENPISFCSEIIYKWPCSTAMLGFQRLSKSGHVACWWSPTSHSDIVNHFDQEPWRTMEWYGAHSKCCFTLW